MSTSNRKEPDYIRRAFRVLNLQAIVALVFVIGMPIIVSYRIIDEWVTDVYVMSRSFADVIHAEYVASPGRERAQALAAQHNALIALESPGEVWYTDGLSSHTLDWDARLPYYAGLWNRYQLDDDVRLVISFPAEFYTMNVHARVVAAWLGAPVLLFLVIFFLLRRTLRPLRWMQGGITELTQGNFAYEAPASGRDRKNHLSRKFNAMTASIRDLIRSKDRLITDLSHELRSPITRIKVALALVPPDRNLTVVERNVQELEDIITTILEAQRINLQDIALKREFCRLADLVRECADLTKGRAPGIALGPVDDALLVSGDRGLLKLLVHNLLDNALKYSGEGSAPVQLTLRRAGSEALLDFEDSGPGIPEDMLLKVFEPFVKVAPERGFNSGYGLGLALCRRIVDLHGGMIALTNRPGGGLHVRVNLPGMPDDHEPGRDPSE
jgi:signal transduction histidine kinase